MSLEESVIQQQEQQLLYCVSLLLRLQNAVPMLCEESTRALSPEYVQTLCKMQRPSVLWWNRIFGSFVV